MAGLHGLHHLAPLAFDGGGVGAQLVLETPLLQHLLAGRHIGSQINPHANGNHAEINNHLHDLRSLSRRCIMKP